MNLKKYDVLIFDCDGIIFDSTELKVEAFRKSLSTYSPTQVQSFIDYFRLNFGKSRYQHVRYFIEEILDIPFDEGIYLPIIEKYGEICKKIYQKAEFCSGVLKVLENYPHSIKYVASGSAQSELRVAFKNRGIDMHFEAIYGSPTSKDYLVKEICSMHKCKKILMIGDSFNDFKAAEFSGIDFLFVERYSPDKVNMKSLATLKKFPAIFDFEAFFK